MSSINVGLIGCGGMGKGLVSQLVTIEGAKIAAGADPFEESRSSFAAEHGVPGYASLSELVAGTEVEAVIVAVPNDLHAPTTIEAARAGKHVFCEKPMALTLADCRAMIEACSEAGVKLQIGQVLRYLPDFAYAIELVKSGQVGDPKHGMIFRYSAPKDNWGQTWRDDVTQVGHCLFEVSVHELDFARCVFGKPVAVSGWDLNFNPSSPLWSQATTAVIEFESGAVCTVVEGMFNPISRSEVEISGTEGALRFGWGGTFLYRSLTGGPELDRRSADIAEGRENGLHRELREWIEAIQNDTPTTIPGEEGMANIELALAILESSKRKARVELPL